MSMLLLSVVILAIAVLLFDVRGETHVDIRHTRGVVVDIIDDAHEKGGLGFIGIMLMIMLYTRHQRHGVHQT